MRGKKKKIADADGPSLVLGISIKSQPVTRPTQAGHQLSQPLHQRRPFLVVSDPVCNSTSSHLLPQGEGGYKDANQKQAEPTSLDDVGSQDRLLPELGTTQALRAASVSSVRSALVSPLRSPGTLSGLAGLQDVESRPHLERTVHLAHIQPVGLLAPDFDVNTFLIPGSRACQRREGCMA